MDAKELRIGNYVLLQDKGVYQIDLGHDIDEIDSFPLDDNYCQGIPLTEQWLMDFGFRKEADHIFLFPSNDSFRLWGFAWNLQEWSFNKNGDGWDDITTPSIKHVHQLQNLYYSLTGEELIKK